MKAICNYCGKEFEKTAGHLNRARKLGVPVYCDKTHAGLGRRHNRTKEESKKLKAEYDKRYRYYHRKGIKEKKAAAFKKDYAENPEKYKEQRRKKYPKHLEYLRTPEYKKWKKEYDLKYHAQKKYGKFWESGVALRKIENELDRHEANMSNQTYNKSQKRKRQWKNSQQTV